MILKLQEDKIKSDQQLAEVSLCSAMLVLTAHQTGSTQQGRSRIESQATSTTTQSFTRDVIV